MKYSDEVVTFDLHLGSLHQWEKCEMFLQSICCWLTLVPFPFLPVTVGLIWLALHCM